MRASNDTNSDLTALSPLDGRYRSQLTAAADIFSEFNLIRQRLHVEVEYLLFLADYRLCPPIPATLRQKLHTLIQNFNLEQASAIKTLEATTKHDVKAVEYFLTDFLTDLKSTAASYVHLGLTSEDTNSLAFGLMIRQAQKQLLLPQLKGVLQQLADLAAQYQTTPMLARTHGQPAVPTTVGKELMVFALRLLAEIQLLESLPVEAKLSGAVGNFNAHQIAFPDQDWPRLSADFTSQLGLTPNLVSTQIVPAETYSRFFSSLLRINTILLDCNQDIWRYISDGYFVQKKEAGQVGSSTMPHKVNPIDFENSEGNLGLANSLLEFFIRKLPVSRLQRDLSDSTVKRSVGSAVGYSCLAYTSFVKGLKKLSLNQALLAQDLDDHWEVLTEAIQVVLRAAGDTQGYQKVQALSQGKKLTAADIHHFITELSLDRSTKSRLLALTPASYLGLAPEITKKSLKIINRYLKVTKK